VTAGSSSEAPVVVRRQQSRWSQAADRRKRQIDRARGTGLGLAVAGAVAGTAASQVTGASPATGRVLAFVAALAIGLAALAQRNASGSAVEEWTRLRSISEALKAELYTYLAGAGRYRTEHRNQRLLDRMDQFVAEAGRLNARIAGVEAADGELPRVADIDSYLTLRVRDQVLNYYRPRERRMDRRAAAFRRAQWVLAVAGTALAALAGVTQTEALAAWIGVVTTVAATVTTHVAAARFEYQQLEYARTANVLESLAARWRDTTEHGAHEADRLVQRVEEIISVQNEGWLVRWSTDHGETP